MNLVPPINQAVLDKSKARARERGIELPTFAQMKDPKLIPDHIAKRLKSVGLWDVDPANLIPGEGKSESTVKETARELLNDLGPQRLIANLGEGLGGKESTDLVKTFVDFIQDKSAAMIAGE